MTSPPLPVCNGIAAPAGHAGVRRTGWLIGAVALLALAAIVSLAVGSRPISPPTVIDTLLHGGHSEDAIVIRTLRIPRTVVGLAVGAALGLAGTVMQGITRNPLAEPGILGVSQGAAMAVVVAISVFGVSSLDEYVWFAFAGAVLAVVGVYTTAGRGRTGISPVKLVLAGAAFSALMASVTSAVLTTDSATLDQFRFWQVGALGGRSMDMAAQMLPFLAAGLVFVFASARGLDALALGEDTAQGLGQRVAVTRLLGALGATLLTGVAVAAAGPVAFAGLAAPHLARLLVGASHRWVLCLSALFGSSLLLLADVIGRVLFPPAEIPAGAMTALIGVPVLVLLVRRKRVVAG
ncbi:MAG: iron transporter permease [Streptosporangiaceae bacterium]|nr:iron transporter permease [Streptosporangiaceae bacterium]